MVHDTCGGLVLEAAACIASQRPGRLWAVQSARPLLLLACHTITERTNQLALRLWLVRPNGANTGACRRQGKLRRVLCHYRTTQVSACQQCAVQNQDVVACGRIVPLSCTSNSECVRATTMILDHASKQVACPRKSFQCNRTDSLSLPLYVFQNIRVTLA
jgi:hypothetical protein